MFNSRHSRVMTIALSGLLVACSLILGMIGKAYFTFGPIRITFENLPVLFGGFLFGPIFGGLIGVMSDFVSCVIAANPINPIITLGAFSIGFLGAFFKKFFGGRKSFASVLICVLIAHAVGSMFVKSVGLRVYYDYPYTLLFLRIPLYLFIGVLEAYGIYSLSKIKFIQKMLERM